MKSRLLWTNYKIYAVIIGMLVGTLVYNIIGVDFSFALIDNIHSENFGESYIFFLLQNIKYFIIIMLNKNVVIPVDNSVSISLLPFVQDFKRTLQFTFGLQNLI